MDCVYLNKKINILHINSGTIFLKKELLMLMYTNVVRMMSRYVVYNHTKLPQRMRIS